MSEKGINITQQTVDNTVWYGATLPLFVGFHWALLILIFADNAVWYWFALPLFAGHHLSLLHRNKHTKELVVVLQWLLATSTYSG